MTRINVGVDPKELSDRHLLAEHREIKRVPNSIKSGKAKVENLPQTFSLGTGHVKFFYNKLGYLLYRYTAIHRECVRRGFKVQNYIEAWVGIPLELMGNYQPTVADRQIVQQRIKERS